MAQCVIIDGSLRRPHHVAVNVCFTLNLRESGLGLLRYISGNQLESSNGL